MRTKIFTKEDKRHIRIQSLASKHGCSREYVGKVLDGERERNSALSQKIVKDATDIIAIYERDTRVTL